MIERELWVFEQLAEAPGPTHFDQKRHQVGVDFSNLSDSFTWGAFGIVDLNWFEIRVKGSQRLFLASTDRGNLLEQTLSDRTQSLGLEIARYVVSSRGHYGRLGLGYLFNFPSRINRWITFNVDTGIMPTAESPWDFHFHLGGFFPGFEETSIFGLRGRVSRFISLSKDVDLGVGALLALHFRTLGGELPEGRYEHFLLTLGPVGELQSPWGRLALRVHWRLWLDRQPKLINGLLEGAAPSELLAVPDFSLRWSLAF